MAKKVKSKKAAAKQPAKLSIFMSCSCELIAMQFDESVSEDTAVITSSASNAMTVEALRSQNRLSGFYAKLGYKMPGDVDFRMAIAVASDANGAIQIDQASGQAVRIPDRVSELVLLLSDPAQQAAAAKKKKKK